MKKYGKLLLVLALLLIIPGVQAKEINHFTSKAGNDVELNDVYNSSVVAAGESVSVNGKVNGIAIMAGDDVETEGEIDYGIIAGNSVDTRGVINNDAIIAGNIITLKEDSHFKRDAIIAGNNVEVNGNFDRNISIYASKVTFKGSNIKGNVKVYADSLTLEKGAVIEGTLSYPEDALYKNKGATIGKVVKTAAIQTQDDENYFATVSAKIWSFLCMALVFAAISLFFPNVFNNIKEKFEKTEVGEIVEVFTKGLVIIILIPVIAILLCCTMIGIPLGIILIVIYALAIYLTSIFTAYLLGYKIWQRVFNREGNLILIGLIGLFILMLLALIPGVRTLASILSVLIGLGLIFDSLKK